MVTDQFIAYTKSLSKYLIEHFKAIGGEVILEDTYTYGDNDFSAQLARLQALGEKPDVIFVSSYGQDIGVIIRSLREVGYNAPVLGGDACLPSAPVGQIEVIALRRARIQPEIALSSAQTTASMWCNHLQLPGHRRADGKHQESLKFWEINQP